MEPRRQQSMEPRDHKSENLGDGSRRLLLTLRHRLGRLILGQGEGEMTVEDGRRAANGVGGVVDTAPLTVEPIVVAGAKAALKRHWDWVDLVRNASASQVMFTIEPQLRRAVLAGYLDLLFEELIEIVDEPSTIDAVEAVGRCLSQQTLSSLAIERLLEATNALNRMASRVEHLLLSTAGEGS